MLLQHPEITVAVIRSRSLRDRPGSPPSLTNRPERPVAARPWRMTLDGKRKLAQSVDQLALFGLCRMKGMATAARSFHAPVPAPLARDQLKGRRWSSATIDVIVDALVHAVEVHNRNAVALSRRPSGGPSCHRHHRKSPWARQSVDKQLAVSPVPTADELLSSAWQQNLDSAGPTGLFEFILGHGAWYLFSARWALDYNRVLKCPLRG